MILVRQFLFAQPFAVLKAPAADTRKPPEGTTAMGMAMERDKDGPLSPRRALSVATASAPESHAAAATTRAEAQSMQTISTAAAELAGHAAAVERTLQWLGPYEGGGGNSAADGGLIAAATADTAASLPPKAPAAETDGAAALVAVASSVTSAVVKGGVAVAATAAAASSSTANAAVPVAATTATTQPTSAASSLPPPQSPAAQSKQPRSPPHAPPSPPPVYTPPSPPPTPAPKTLAQPPLPVPVVSAEVHAVLANEHDLRYSTCSVEDLQDECKEYGLFVPVSASGPGPATVAGQSSSASAHTPSVADYRKALFELELCFREPHAAKSKSKLSAEVNDRDLFVNSSNINGQSNPL